ncbi:4988_t:CDS:2 [Funneliformis caledonium]|uniref:4988_t:CDS:1 n=1 Tax=Funneliformis caledonium TaxID=1117310 RepID=A0A9N9FCC2_9GLOM|nr:4988_t:CDS:2 [Funneliformis caledonium]
MSKKLKLRPKVSCYYKKCDDKVKDNPMLDDTYEDNTRKADYEDDIYEDDICDNDIIMIDDNNNYQYEEFSIRKPISNEESEQYINSSSDDDEESHNLNNDESIDDNELDLDNYDDDFFTALSSIELNYDSDQEISETMNKEI